MIYVRGHPSDFDAWADAGAEGWDWRSVEPFFSDSKICQLNLNRAVCGYSRPAHLWGALHCRLRGGGYTAQRQLPLWRYLGAGYLPKCVQGLATKRQGGFLGPGDGSANLTVCSDHLVDRCVISDGRVTGVLVRDKQNRQSLIEGRHMILAAGAIGSPTLLQRSGVGEAEHLQRCGIQPVIDRPAVGQNLQDHFGTLVATETTPEGTVWADVRPWRLPLQLWRYVTQRKACWRCRPRMSVSFTSRGWAGQVYRISNSLYARRGYA